MSRTQLAFNSGDLAFQEIITSRPNRNSATRVVSQNAVWPVTGTFPSTPLYIHVEKDFQSHHMQIYSSTLMGGQERERKCVRNAYRSASFSIFLRTGSALMEHCMLTRAGIRYRSGQEVKLEIPASFFPTAGQQGLVMLTFA